MPYRRLIDFLRAVRMSALHQVRLFFVALQFFTRLPVPRWVGFEPEWLQHAARYFPLVGLLVAVPICVVYAIAAWCLPQAVAVLLSTAFGILLTGAFHEDGFADLCDGFGGGLSAARVLEIMTDSRIGAYGAIGISLLLALKCVTLAYLSPVVAIAALLVAHPVSRLWACALIVRLDYVRAEGKAKPLAQQMSAVEFVIAAATVLIPTIYIGLTGALSWNALLLGTLATTLAAFWLARMFVRRIGGYTGDCLGAVQQVTEVVFYLAVLALQPHLAPPTA